jgi:hypothetical protein
MLAHQGPHDAVLNQHRQGLPPRSPETSDPLSTFPSGDTPLVVPYFPAHVSNYGNFRSLKEIQL